MRKSVEDFANSMEAILKDNDRKTGWSYISTAKLIRMLKAEVTELDQAFDNCNPERVCHEVTDVANFCMMIHDNLTKREKK